MANKFYVTTAIPYANAPPHIGFALEIVQADVLARWNRLLKKDVFFLTGTDEHGSKNYRLAEEKGLTPKQFVDKNSAFFKELTKALNISNNYFIRTTDKKVHWPGVFEIWRLLEKKGDIYKKKYEGFYCSGCERFVTERDLINGKCPDHPSLEIEKIKEENYFFRLSKYSDKIKELVENDKFKISPDKWKNNFLGLIKEGLTDISFSRDKKHLPWGIPVPGDENQILYVWPDALTNYLTGIGYPNKEYKKYWPADVHIVGKDMLRFHAGIWPGMLLSAGIELPKRLIVHGFLIVGGQKMSKSLGNVVAPLELLKRYSADSLRYFLMRNTPFGEDGDFDEKALIDRHNNELANKLGNLISRVSGLIEKNGIEKCENKLLKELNLKKIEKLFENFEFDKVLNGIFAFIDICNEYVQNKKPWESKDKKILYELADSIKAIAIVLSPFIPSTSEKIAKQFGFKIEFNEVNIPLNEKTRIKKGEILFKKI
ncbi:MAG: methionine--tRNA ligase [Candidatus Diapherotrites archaeon]